MLGCRYHITKTNIKSWFVQSLSRFVRQMYYVWLEMYFSVLTFFQLPPSPRFQRWWKFQWFCYCPFFFCSFVPCKSKQTWRQMLFRNKHSELQKELSSSFTPDKEEGVRWFMTCHSLEGFLRSFPNASDDAYLYYYLFFSFHQRTNIWTKVLTAKNVSLSSIFAPEIYITM